GGGDDGDAGGRHFCWRGSSLLRLRAGVARARRTTKGHACRPQRSRAKETTMDYVKPADVATAMVETGKRKLALPTADLLIRGILSGAILGVATSLALTGAVSTGQPLVGAIIFPVGLIMIVLLGLELITGSFALLPLPWLDGEASGASVLGNWGWVFVA